MFAYFMLSCELRSCVKVEVVVLGSPSLNKPTVCVDVKQHFSILSCEFESLQWFSSLAVLMRKSFWW